MTTSVTVTTTNWPVKVTFTDTINDLGDQRVSDDTVAPNSSLEIHLTANRQATFTELPSSAANAADVAPQGDAAADQTSDAGGADAATASDDDAAGAATADISAVAAAG